MAVVLLAALAADGWRDINPLAVVVGLLVLALAIWGWAMRWPPRGRP